MLLMLGVTPGGGAGGPPWRRVGRVALGGGAGGPPWRWSKTHTRLDAPGGATPRKNRLTQMATLA